MINGKRNFSPAPDDPLSGDEVDQRLKVLRLMISVRETTAPYNQFCLGQLDRYDLTLCTFFPAQLAPPPVIRLRDGDGTVLGFLKSLRAALARSPYDVIHAHAAHVACLLFLAKLLGARVAGARTVFTMHNSYTSYGLRIRLMLLPVFACFDRVVCCGEASRASLPRLYRWLAGKRLDAVTNGVDLERVDRAIAAGLPERTAEDGCRIVSIGRLIGIKNPMTVLQAFGRSGRPDSRLIFAGDGPLYQGLSEAVAHLVTDGEVEFLGLIPRDRVYDLLAEADLFVSASRGEGLPVAPLEAMACRCPVILSDIPPHREIAKGADFIPLIDPDDLSGFERELIRFQDMSGAQRRAIGDRCRRLVEERFSAQAMRSGYDRIYRSLLAES